MNNFIFIQILKNLNSLCVENRLKELEDLIIEYLSWLSYSIKEFGKDYNKYIDVLETCFTTVYFEKDYTACSEIIADAISYMYLDMEEEE